MPINFPNNPSLNDTFVINNITYTWNGTSWTAAKTVFGYIGDAIISPIGVEIAAIADPGKFNASGEVSYNWSWFVNGVDQGVNANTFTPNTGQDGLDLTCQIEITDDNGTEIINLGPVTILSVAPVLISPLDDLSYDNGFGDQTLATSDAFQGTNITYSIDSAPAGVTINESTGLVTISTDVNFIGDVTVRATNSGGFITDTFQVEVKDSTSATDPGVISIDTNGWQVTHSSPTTYDPIGDPKFVAVTRSGFSVEGTPTTFLDDLIINTQIRLPYPNESTLTTDKVAISDYIYATDTVSGVTNNSTILAPKPIPMWLNYDKEVVLDGTYTAKITVAHAHAMSGTPVAAVKFIISDGVNPNVESLVNTMTTKYYATTDLYAPHYEATMDISSLNDGLLTLDVIIYPWVGAAYQASVDGDAYPSVNFSPLKIYNDTGNTLGRAYAYVDIGALGGSVSANPVQAQGTPFPDLTSAATALLAFNNTNYGRSNLSGSWILLESGEHTTSSMRPAGLTVGGLGPLVIASANPANKATTVIRDNGAATANTAPDNLIVEDIILRRYGTNVRAIFDSNARLNDVDHSIAIIRCDFEEPETNGDLRGTTIYRCGRVYMQECGAGTDHQGHAERYSTNNNIRYNVGVVNGACTSAHSAVACDHWGGRSYGIVSQEGTTQRPESFGQFFGWNHLHNNSSTRRSVTVQHNLNSDGSINHIDDRGFALVGNVFEHTVNGSGPTLAFSSGNTMGEVRNFVAMCNTTVGGDSQLLYLSGGDGVTVYPQVNWTKYGYYKYNIDHSFYIQSDLQAGQIGITLNVDGIQPAELDGGVGNWAFWYKVGILSNTCVSGDVFNGDQHGEIIELGGLHGTPETNIVTDYLDDNTGRTGTQTVGTRGDYTPGALSAVSVIPAGFSPYPIDHKGRAIANDGTAVAGAIQKAS